MRIDRLDPSEMEEIIRYIMNEAATIVNRAATIVPVLQHLPTMHKGLLDTLDMVFIPKQIASQLVLALALETSMVTVNQIWQIFRSVAASISTHSRLIGQLKVEQTQSLSQDEWMDLAEQIDNIQGNDVWRTERNCRLYESEKNTG